MRLNSGKLLRLYRRCFCRRAFYKFNKGLYFLSLTGLGIGNWENPIVSGESHFLAKFTKAVGKPVVLDIGANVGNYSNLVKTLAPDAVIFAFEPHPMTFRSLCESAEKFRFRAFNLACGDVVGKGMLFDHKNRGEETGTEHASLVKDVIETVHSGESEFWDVQITTIDEFVRQNGLGRIDLMKIDVEGSEIKVLNGARKSLERSAVDFIHFEFTQSSILSRVFMKDFVELLADYDFYRMLPDGLAPMGVYYPPIFEIFSYQNILAVRKGVRSWLN